MYGPPNTNSFDASASPGVNGQRCTNPLFPLRTNPCEHPAVLRDHLSIHSGQTRPRLRFRDLPEAEAWYVLDVEASRSPKWTPFASKVATR